MLFSPLAQYLIYGKHLYSLSVRTKRVQIFTSTYSEEDKQLLEKILTACKIKKREWLLSRVKDTLESSFILFFGLTKEDLSYYGAGDLPYFMEKKDQNRYIICAPSLHTFHNNMEQKKLLWQVLQKVFFT